MPSPRKFSHLCSSRTFYFSGISSSFCQHNRQLGDVRRPQHKPYPPCSSHTFYFSCIFFSLWQHNRQQMPSPRKLSRLCSSHTFYVFCTFSCFCQRRRQTPFSQCTRFFSNYILLLSYTPSSQGHRIERPPGL